MKEFKIGDIVVKRHGLTQNEIRDDCETLYWGYDEMLKRFNKLPNSVTITDIYNNHKYVRFKGSNFLFYANWFQHFDYLDVL